MSKNFKLEEFTYSKTAIENNIDNNIKSFKVAENLVHTVRGAEMVRSVLGCPVIITSGYRCDELNKFVNGVKDSQHKKGQAFDFITKKYTPEQAFEKLKGRFPYDQLILKPKCVHISFVKSFNPRKECLIEISRVDREYKKG